MSAPSSKIITRPGLLTPSFAYKPFRYPWAYDFWKTQQQVHWIPEEVPLGEDCKDWASKLTDGERNLLTQIFRFFTQSDVEVNDNYMERYGRVFKPTEVNMLMNFPRFNKMKGMGQIVSWSVRDESLHCEGMIKLYHAFAKETGALTQSVKDDIIENCRTVVSLEDRFIELAFEAGEVQGMTPEDIKAYIRFIADWRLRQLDLPEIYGGVKENPLPWLQALLSGVEHANFFEARATEYSKAATRGQWQGADGVWSNFDNLMNRRTVPSEPAE